MKGKVGTYPKTGDPVIDKDLNIWEQTKRTLNETIDQIQTDGTVNVTVIPFEDPNNPRGFAHEIKEISSLDEQEKNDLKNWITDYEGSPHEKASNTNICAALDMAFSKVNLKAHHSDNTILLFSDGGQSASDVKYNKRTCLNERFREFCEVYCDATGDSNNRMYLLKLKHVQTGGFSCECVQEFTPNDGCKFTNYVTLRPTFGTMVMSYDDLQRTNSLEMRFETVVGSLPKDFQVRATSSNPLLSTNASNKSLDTDGTLTIQFNNMEVEEDSEQSTIISFDGITAEDCYKVSIQPLSLIVKHKLIPEFIFDKIVPVKDKQ
jgi:hypothetical protein